MATRQLSRPKTDAKEMKFTAIIPARYASTRFPGKPLALLGGREVINHVVDRVQSAGLPAVVATDDRRIFECVERAGAKAVMTRSDHLCGTDRVREAADMLSPDIDVIINVQGDEPFIHPDQLRALMQIFELYPDTEIATLVRPLPSGTTYEELADPSLVKVVIDHEGKALYFSRFPVPYLRGIDQSLWTSQHQYLAHVGVYAYRTATLRKITQMTAGILERAESLEQLRWLEAGMEIRTAMTTIAGIGIDTPQDLVKAEAYLQNGC